MIGDISLVVKGGQLDGKEFVLANDQSVTIGRADDCDVRFPPDLEYRTISRHHCVLQIQLPAIRLRDLGSRNGTFVNGIRLFHSSDCPPTGEAVATSTSEYELQDGDYLGLGSTILQIRVAEPASLVEGKTAVGVVQSLPSPASSRYSAIPWAGMPVFF